MTKRLLAFGLAGAALFTSRPTSARDDRLSFPIKAALDHVEARQKVDPAIRLYFGKQAYPKPEAEFGDYKANDKTRAFNRTDQEACDWVFLSAVLKLQQRARQLQANAVVDIKSIYKNEIFESDKEYRCGAGSFVAGVALTGRFVRLPK